MKTLTIGAICARGGSKGVQRKALRTLSGKTLLAHTIDCARACPSLDRIVVSTDDVEIAEHATRAGAEVPFIRPAELALDTSPKWPVFRHLVETYERLAAAPVGVLVDLDVGVPLRQPTDVEDCLAKLRNASFDVVTTGYAAERNPYFNMVEIDASGCAQISKRPAQPITRRQDAPAVYSLSPAIFAIRRDALWVFDHWSQACFAIHVMPRERAVDIDTEVDYRLVETLWGLQTA
jgi:CMP-N,N'-diacetyllegionaminic acid synthase